MTTAAGRRPPALLLRWIMVVGALFAVALFGGSSYGDGHLPTVPVSGYTACPNVILQASLPGALTGEPGRGGPRDGGHGPGEAFAGACLFVIVAVAGLALAGAARRPLLVHATFWWARLRVAVRWPSTAGPMWMSVLRI